MTSLPPASGNVLPVLPIGWFENAMEASDVGMALISLDGVFLAVNPALARLLGREVADLEGVSCRAASHSEDCFLDAETIGQLQRGQITFHRKLRRYVRQDGAEAHAFQTITLLRHPNGSPECYLIQATDAAENVQKAEERRRSRERLSLTLDALMDPVIQLDAVRNGSGQIVDLVFGSVNQAFATYSGLPGDEILGRGLIEWRPRAASSPIIDLLVQTIETGEPLVADAAPLPSMVFGDMRRFDIRGTRFGDGIVVSFRDVTEQHAAVARIVDSERRLRLLAENTTDMITLAEDGRFEWITPSVEALLGWRTAEVVGSSVVELVHPEDRAAVVEREYRAERGEHSSGRYRVRAKDGSYHWIAGAIGPVAADDGSQRGTLVSARVIDAEVAAEERAQALAAEQARLIEQIPVGVFRARMHADGRREIDFVSRRAAAILGRSFERGSDPTAVKGVIETDQVEAFRAAVRRSVTTLAPLRWEGRRRDADAWLRFEVAFEAHDQDGLLIEGLVQDITAAKRYEAELVAARERAESAAQARATFLANMSHEIRTPLTAVLGLLRLLEDTPLDDEQRRYATRAERAGRTLLSLLNGILDFTKVEADRIHLDARRFDLHELLRDIASVAAANLDTPLELLFDIDPEIPIALIGDDTRLRQVLLNILGNAIKFTDHGEVALAIDLVAKGDGEVELRFSVRDTGIGMAPEEQERVFDSFVQADPSVVRRHGGTGLGLAISQRLVALMGGNLVVTSEVGLGSTFSFIVRFPVAHPAEAVRTDVPESARVLVVGASPAYEDLLQRMCRPLGWGVECVPAGAASSAVASRPHDVVLLDDSLDTSGIEELIAALSTRRNAGPAPAVVVMRAHPQLPAGLVNRVDGFLLKPFLATDLIAEVARARGAHALSVAAPTRRLAGVRVLVVEDDPLNREIAAELLRREGAVVTEAVDGAQAVARLRTNPASCDVVLMDMQLPVMDGLEATRRIRETHPAGTLPILAMTANALPVEHAACLAAGMDDHLRKPFDLDQVVRLILLWTNPEKAALLDTPAALERVGGDAAFYDDLLGQLMAAVPEYVARIDDALGKGERAAAEHAAHALKGAAATLGADQLADGARRLEEAARAGGDLAALVALRGQIAETAGRTAVAVEAWRVSRP